MSALKVVYFGPGLAGKTINMQMLHRALGSPRNALTSVATEVARHLYADLVLPTVDGAPFPIQLRTEPG